VSVRRWTIHDARLAFCYRMLNSGRVNGRFNACRADTPICKRKHPQLWQSCNNCLGLGFLECKRLRPALTIALQVPGKQALSMVDWVRGAMVAVTERYRSAKARRKRGACSMLLRARLEHSPAVPSASTGKSAPFRRQPGCAWARFPEALANLDHAGTGRAESTSTWLPWRYDSAHTRLGTSSARRSRTRLLAAKHKC